MYGQTDSVLKEWKMLQDMTPPKDVFGGTKSQWMRRNTLNRRKFWQDFMRKSLSSKDKFSPFFSKKNGYWFFDFEALEFKKSKDTKNEEKLKILDQKALKRAIEENAIKKQFLPSTSSVVEQQFQQEKLEKPLRIVNKPTEPEREESPLVLIDTDIKAPQMPLEQAPIMPVESQQQTISPELIPTDVQQALELEMVKSEKKSKVPLIIGSAIVGLILLKVLK
tara:strand:+ start:397 stop:1062 length:666 start_codon:yes stop_codon:yes gene_type:complete